MCERDVGHLLSSGNVGAAGVLKEPSIEAARTVHAPEQKTHEKEGLKLQANGWADSGIATTKRRDSR